MVEGKYIELLPINDRIHSEILGLDLVIEGEDLRLYDPQTEQWLLTPLELTKRLEEEKQRVEVEARARAEAENARQKSENARREAEAENARLRAELDALRRQKGE